MANVGLKHMLKQLIDNGLVFSDCVQVFAEARSPEHLEYVKSAQAKHTCDEGNIEVDDSAIVSENDAGPYVMCWTFVRNEESEDGQD